MLFLMAPIFAVVFVIYFLYRWLITKDLKKHKTTIYTGLIFAGIWSVLLLILSAM